MASTASTLSRDLMYPTEEFLPYEEKVLLSPYNMEPWLCYLNALADAPFERRQVVYERALRNVPKCFKIWHAYLRERLELVRNLPDTHPKCKSLNNTFERALVTMHKMPRIWIMYLELLTRQKLITVTRRTFDKALCALPVTQHDRIWGLYLNFVRQGGIPIETSLRVYRRYLTYDPSHIEDFIEFLRDSGQWQEAAERLAGVLNDNEFYSIKGKTKYSLWLELCELLTHHADEITGLNVDAIIRGGIGKFTEEVGLLWAKLAEYYVLRKLFEKARDICEEGMAKVVTVRDFNVIFDAYLQFEETTIMNTMEYMSDSVSVDVGQENEEEEEDKFDVEKLIKKCKGHWLREDVLAEDVDLGLVKLDHLIDRWPELANSVQLRQNPHNVKHWHWRVKLFEGNPTKQLLTYTEAVETVDPMKAVGKPHTLWVAFAKLYESHKDISNARIIFDKAVQVNYKAVDHLTSVWSDWAEMELRHKNFDGVLDLMRRATAEPSVEVNRRGSCNESMTSYSWTEGVPAAEKLGIYEINIARAAEIFGVPKIREIYEQVIESGLTNNKDVKVMCMRYADFEKSMCEIDRARALYMHASQFPDPTSDSDFWVKWQDFEVHHGNEATFRKMQSKRNIDANQNQDAKDVLKKAGVAEDEMAAQKRQSMLTTNDMAEDAKRVVGFVSAGVESTVDTAKSALVSKEDIELPDADSDCEDDSTAVFGGLVWKRGEGDDVDGSTDAANNSALGALARIKGSQGT